MLGLGNNIAIGVLGLCALMLIMGVACIFTNSHLIFKNWYTLIISAILFFSVPCIASINYDWNFYKSYICQFEVEKEIIETAMSIESLSSYDRSEIIKCAIEANKVLADYKYDCKQWYGMAIPDEILDVEFIKLK